MNIPYINTAISLKSISIAHVYTLLQLALSLVFSVQVFYMDLNGLQISYLQNSMKIIAVEKDVGFVALKHT